MRKTVQKFLVWLRGNPKYLEQGIPDVSRSFGFGIVCALLMAAMLVPFAGCVTSPSTGTAVVDVRRIDAVRAAVQPVIEQAVAMVIERHPEKRKAVADYVGTGAAIFCEMSKNKVFSPDVLVREVERHLLPKVNDELALAAISAVLVVYHLEWGKRLDVPVSEEDWMWPVARVMCDLLDGVEKRLLRGESLRQ